jgi:hypothetical protein
MRAPLTGVQLLQGMHIKGFQILALTAGLTQTVPIALRSYEIKGPYQPPQPWQLGISSLGGRRHYRSSLIKHQRRRQGPQERAQARLGCNACRGSYEGIPRIPGELDPAEPMSHLRVEYSSTGWAL